MKEIGANGPQSNEISAVDVTIVNNRSHDGQQTNGNGMNGNMQDEQEERKITQTDHLNKKLLSSFLDRINQNPSLIPVECAPADENDDDFVDKTPES